MDGFSRFNKKQTYESSLELFPYVFRSKWATFTVSFRTNDNICHPHLICDEDWRNEELF